MPTYPLPTLAAQVTSAGVSAPSYADILASLQASFRAIFGSDSYIEPDSQDGQLLAVIAAAINDCNNSAIAVYNSFSPTYAQGAGLSSVVKINGIRRRLPTFSSAVGNVSGDAGTVITDGVVQDQNKNNWDLPSPLTIPVGGVIAVTVIAQQPGAISALTGTINKIQTPQLGWQSFVSTSDAEPGVAVENDAQLRRRQAVSVSLPAITPVGALMATVANLTGVTRTKVYENPDGAPDGNGLPAHSISAVVEGGTVQDIVNTIGAKKTPGAATYGTTSGTYVDPMTGINYTINFFVLANVSIDVNLVGTILAGTGYSSAIAAEVKQSIADYLNSLDIGQDIQYSRLWTPAYLNGAPHGNTYEITTLQIRVHAGTYGVVDIPVPFNKVAFCDIANISVSIT